MKKVFQIRVINDVTGEVIGSKAATYDLTKKEYESPMFIKSLLDEEGKLLKECVKTQIEEIT